MAVPTPSPYRYPAPKTSLPQIPWHEKGNTLYFKDFTLFGLENLIDFGDKAIGGLLDMLLAATVVILSKLFVFFQGFQRVIPFPSDVPQGHLSFLTDFLHLFH